MILVDASIVRKTDIQTYSDNHVSLDPVLHLLGLHYFKDNAMTEISQND